MPIEKTLQKIKISIGELSDTMQSFVHENIQPSASDCDKLRQQMNDLLELLAVYKHNKTNNEIEPGFNLHARVSEKAEAVEQARGTVEAEAHHKTEEKKPEKTITPAEHSKHSKNDGLPLVIGINDKFRFINELFSQNNSEYNIVMEQLNNVRNWHDTEVYLNSLKGVYGWKDSSETVKYFYSLVKKRFE